MKFLINATNLKSGGALQVARSLLQAWQRQAGDHEFHVVAGPALHLLQSDIPPGNLHFYAYPVHPHFLRYSRYQFQRFMSELEARIAADVACTIFGPSLWRSHCPQLCGFANGIYLFENDPYIRARYPAMSVSGIRYRLYRKLLLNTLFKNADALWVETENAASAIRKLKGADKKPIYVVGNTYPAELTQSRTDTHFGRARFLYLSAYYPHKNFGLLPELIRILKARNIAVCFLLSLPKIQFEKIAAAVADTDYLHNVGPVGIERLQEVYDSCNFVLMPSLLETFSGNFPEAMRSGKPIVCSDRAFARETCEDAALYFDPLSAKDAADKIEQLLSQPALQEQLTLAGYRRLEHMESPESRAEKLLQHLIHLAQKTDTPCVA